jgi:hypothetical protein
MDRLTKSGTVSGKDINELLDENNENQMGKTKAYYKLQEYEDLEEELESIYGECPGLLKKIIDTLKSHPNIEETPVKSRLLTDEDADKWLEYKQLEEQGRLTKLPCKVGDDVYYILGIPNKTPCVIDKCTFELSDINKIGKTLFLTREEAEAKLKELRGINFFTCIFIYSFYIWNFHA